MSVLTEKSDLLAVMDGIEALDYVDTDNLFLFGQSQGGFVSTLAGVDRLDEVKAMVLLYPAYSLQDGCWERHGSIDNDPTGIGCAHQAVRTCNLLERIVSGLLAQMVDQQNADIILVSQRFELHPIC